MKHSSGITSYSLIYLKEQIIKTHNKKLSSITFFPPLDYEIKIFQSAAWRGEGVGVGKGHHFSKGTQGRQNQVGPPWVQNPRQIPDTVRA